MARFRVVTKYQISGWRFLLRRIEHALVRRDASMIDDPQRGRSTALSIGLALTCLLIAGSAVLAFFKPAKQIGEAHIIADKDSGALFVHLDGRLYPALNLTSARLLAGAAENPVPVSREELARYPRGPLVGIPGAPGVIAATGVQDSHWAVCDTTHLGAAAPVDQNTGLPTTGRSAVRTVAIGTALSVDGDAIRPLGQDEARLLRAGSTTWLVYDDIGHGIVRAAIDLGDSAVTLALGIDATAPVIPVSRGLIEAIEEAPPLKVPEIPGAGQPVALSSGLTVPVGSVLTVPAVERPATHYLLSQSGIVQVSAVLSAMIRNADSHGSVSARTVGPDVIAANLRSGSWPGTAAFPTEPVHILDPERFAVTCFDWSRGAGEPTATIGLLVGRQLPLTAEEQNRTVPLVTALGSGGSTADAAYLARDTGRFVRVTGSDPASPLREALFWISDSGVRYGVDAHLDTARDPTLAALGLRAPVLAPWSVVSLFAVGPTLSQQDARIQHDGLAADKRALPLPGGQP
ncbi:type VII secretion protein EccB [Nocardia sp. NPDC004722]